jgi:mitogen-activated protein kinase 7
MDDLNKFQNELNRTWDCSRYKLIELIGSGTYGVVYKAVDSNKNVAIKKISKAFGSLILAKRTLREIQILSSLSHENIIGLSRVSESQSDDNSDEPITHKDIYIVLDLMESDLHRVIYSDQNISIDHLMYFVYQLLSGVFYLHSANIVHRDLKPSNILVNANCEIKIGDFGMARCLSCVDANTSKNNDNLLTQYVATRWYRAPELMYIKNYSEKIDIWSLGCIFSELITRRPLFPSKNCFGSLKLIFERLGVPNEEFLDQIENHSLKEMLKNYLGAKSLSLKILHPNIDDNGLDLLEQMLMVDFNRRPAAISLLEHPFVQLYRNKSSEKIARLPVDFYTELEVTITDIRSFRMNRKYYSIKVIYFFEYIIIFIYVRSH